MLLRNEPSKSLCQSQLSPPWQRLIGRLEIHYLYILGPTERVSRSSAHAFPGHLRTPPSGERVWQGGWGGGGGGGANHVHC